MIPVIVKKGVASYLSLMLAFVAEEQMVDLILVAMLMKLWINEDARKKSRVQRRKKD